MGSEGTEAELPCGAVPAGCSSSHPSGGISKAFTEPTGPGLSWGCVEGPGEGEMTRVLGPGQRILLPGSVVRRPDNVHVLSHSAASYFFY